MLPDFQITAIHCKYRRIQVANASDVRMIAGTRIEILVHAHW